MSAQPRTAEGAQARSQPRSQARSLSALLAGFATVAPRDERDIHGLSLDSRRTGVNDLFIAVPGARRDGRDYLRQAVQNGAVAAVCHQASTKTTQKVSQKSAVPEAREPAVPSFAVAGLKAQIGVIADRFYGHPSAQMRVIGITGTNGKTTCAYLLAQALNRLGRRCALMGTVGAGFVGALESAPAALTTADAVATHRRLAELLEAKADAVCLEASSHGLAQGRVNAIAFEVALFTNLSRDHLDYHHSMERYGRAKGKLFRFDGLQSAVLNVDDPFGRRLLTEHRAARCIGYGCNEKNGADLCAQNLNLNEHGITFTARYRAQTAVVRSPLIGELNVPNLLAVVAVLIACGWDVAAAAAAVGECSPPPGRMELLSPVATSDQDQDASRPAVVVDYAHTPDALERALVSLGKLCRGKLWVVFGCGGERDRGKRPQMGAVAERLAERVILTDDNPRSEDPAAIAAHIANGMTGPATIIHDRRRAIQTAVAAADAGDIVLVAGKGHETTQTIGGRVVALNDRDIVTGMWGRRP